jgi:hypothetical protein
MIQPPGLDVFLYLVIPFLGNSRRNPIREEKSFIPGKLLDRPLNFLNCAHARKLPHHDGVSNNLMTENSGSAPQGLTETCQWGVARRVRSFPCLSGIRSVAALSEYSDGSGRKILVGPSENSGFVAEAFQESWEIETNLPRRLRPRLAWERIDFIHRE